LATFGDVGDMSATRRRHVELRTLAAAHVSGNPPMYDVPKDINFHKTVIAGNPSGDKRMILMQMEALTGWPTKDETDLWGSGMSNHPFILHQGKLPPS